MNRIFPRMWSFRRADRAEVGIGTLIVFIAMILVAAVAATVLIQTSGVLQQKAQDTGSQAVSQVGTNLETVGIYGNRTATTGNMADIVIHLKLAAGATEMDLSKLTIRYVDGSNLRTLSWSQTASEATNTSQFNTTIQRNVGGTFSYSAPVISQGDLVEIRIYAVDLGTRTDVEITITPEVGSTVELGFRTPNAYGTALHVRYA